MGIIYHVIVSKDWDDAKRKGSYEAPSLKLEGFIHCSRAEQVAGVLQRYYQGVEHLYLLKIEETKLISPLRYDVSTGGELFPHIYGALNLDAVVEVADIDHSSKWLGESAVKGS